MRIVDRATFLKLPPGTVYAKFGGAPTMQDCIDIGELCIKTDHRGGVDWFYLSLAAWPAHDDTDGLIDVFDRLRAGEEMQPDFETGTDDGLFDQGQLFAVFSDADVEALIDRLQRARAEARAETAVSA